MQQKRPLSERPFSLVAHRVSQCRGYRAQMSQTAGATHNPSPATLGWTLFFTVVFFLLNVAWTVWRVCIGVMVGVTWAFFSALLKKR